MTTTSEIPAARDRHEGGALHIGTWGTGPAPESCPSGMKMGAAYIRPGSFAEKAEATQAQKALAALGIASTVQFWSASEVATDWAKVREEFLARRENPAIARILDHAEKAWEGQIECAFADALDGELGSAAYDLADKAYGHLPKGTRPTGWTVTPEAVWQVYSAEGDTEDSGGWSAWAGE